MKKRVLSLLLSGALLFQVTSTQLVVHASSADPSLGSIVSSEEEYTPDAETGDGEVQSQTGIQESEYPTENVSAESSVVTDVPSTEQSVDNDDPDSSDSASTDAGSGETIDDPSTDATIPSEISSEESSISDEASTSGSDSSAEASTSDDESSLDVSTDSESEDQDAESDDAALAASDEEDDLEVQATPRTPVNLYIDMVPDADEHNPEDYMTIDFNWSGYSGEQYKDESGNTILPTIGLNDCEEIDKNGHDYAYKIQSGGHLNLCVDISEILSRDFGVEAIFKVNNNSCTTRKDTYNNVVKNYTTYTNVPAKDITVEISMKHNKEDLNSFNYSLILSDKTDGATDIDETSGITIHNGESRKLRVKLGFNGREITGSDVNKSMNGLVAVLKSESAGYSYDRYTGEIENQQYVRVTNYGDEAGILLKGISDTAPSDLVLYVNLRYSNSEFECTVPVHCEPAQGTYEDISERPILYAESEIQLARLVQEQVHDHRNTICIYLSSELNEELKRKYTKTVKYDYESYDTCYYSLLRACNYFDDYAPSDTPYGDYCFGSMRNYTVNSYMHDRYFNGVLYPTIEFSVEDYWLDASTEQVIDDYINAALSEGGPLYQYRNKSDYEKANAACTWAYKAGRHITSYNAVDHSPYGIIKNGKGTCEAYTLLFGRALLGLGVQNHMMNTTLDQSGNNHSYSLVLLDGKYYRYDASNNTHAAAANKSSYLPCDPTDNDVFMERIISKRSSSAYSNVHPVESVKISGAVATIVENDTLQLAGSYLPDTANSGVDLSWSSSDPSIATVDKNTGLVTAISEGSGTITLSSGNGKKDTVIITVAGAPVSATGISLSSTSLTLSEGGQATLAYNVTPANANGYIVKWESTDSNVATVSDGVVTAASTVTGLASATITAVVCDTTTEEALLGTGSQPITAECQVTVEHTAYLSAVTISKQSIQLTQKANQKKQPSAVINAEALDSSSGNRITDKDLIIWTSNSDDIVFSTKDNPEPAKELRSDAGENVTVTTTYSGADDVTAVITATVNFNGTEVTDTCKVSVVAPVYTLSSLKLADEARLGERNTAPAKTMNVGGTMNLVAIKNPVKAGGNIEWKTSNSSVLALGPATVGGASDPYASKVEVTAEGTGSATITAVCGVKKVSLTVTVQDAAHATLADLTIRGKSKVDESYTMDLNEKVIIDPVFSPLNATLRTVKYTISDKAQKQLVTISGNTITAKKPGTVEITGTYTNANKETFTKTLTVIISDDQMDKESLTAANKATGIAINDAFGNPMEDGIVLVMNQSIVLTALPQPATVTSKVSWKSSKSGVATVKDGLITAKGVGETVITAYIGKDVKTEISVLVIAPLEYVTLNKTELLLTADKTQTLTATITPGKAASRDVDYTWTEVTDITGNTAVTSGNELLQANDRKYSTLAEDNSKTVKFTATSNAKLGDVAYLKVTVTPHEGSYYTSESGVSAVCAVRITQSPSSVRLLTPADEHLTFKTVGKQTKAELTLYTNPVSDEEQVGVYQLQAGADYATVDNDGETDSIVWSSSNKKVASVDQSGFVRAIGKGKATITAKSGAKSTTVAVTVLTNVTRVTPARSDLAIVPGKKNVALKLTFDNKNAAPETVVWPEHVTYTDPVSSEVSTIDIQSKGASLLITTPKTTDNGTPVTTAQTYYVTGTCMNGAQTTIRVVVTPAVSKLAWSNVTAKTTMSSGSHRKFKIKATPVGKGALPAAITDGTEIIWTSANPAIVSVDRYGQVTARAVGKTTITAEYGGKKVTCTVTVQ